MIVDGFLHHVPSHWINQASILNKVGTMAADALAPCVARSSVAMVLITLLLKKNEYKRAIVFHDNWFHPPTTNYRKFKSHDVTPPNRHMCGRPSCRDPPSKALARVAGRSQDPTPGATGAPLLTPNMAPPPKVPPLTSYTPPLGTSSCGEGISILFPVGRRRGYFRGRRAAEAVHIGAGVMRAAFSELPRQSPLPSEVIVLKIP